MCFDFQARSELHGVHRGCKLRRAVPPRPATGASCIQRIATDNQRTLGHSAARIDARPVARLGRYRSSLRLPARAVSRYAANGKKV